MTPEKSSRPLNCKILACVRCYDQLTVNRLLKFFGWFSGFNYLRRLRSTYGIVNKYIVNS